MWPVPEEMTRSAIYRRLPMTTRMDLDGALLLRTENGQTLESIASRFRLKESYRIGLAALKAYVGHLESAVRPVAKSLMIANLMGCLPAEQRAKLTEGSRVLLLSRVLQLMDQSDPPLSVGDIARLATLFKSSSGPAPHSTRASSEESAGDSNAARDAPPDDGGLHYVNEAVRRLYGLEASTSPSGT